MDMHDALEKYFGEARKIRSISLDTNIIIDVLFHMYLRNSLGKGSWVKDYLARCEESYNLLFTFLCSRVKFIGIKSVRKELSSKGLLNIYRSLFKEEIKMNPQIRGLARLYESAANIKSVDAIILATVTLSDIDLFCTWNREDMVKEKSLQKMEEINREKNLNIPVIITPKMFLERFGITQKKTILFTVSKVPKVFRPRFSFPK